MSLIINSLELQNYQAEIETKIGTTTTQDFYKPTTHQLKQPIISKSEVLQDSYKMKGSQFKKNIKKNTIPALTIINFCLFVAFSIFYFIDRYTQRDPQVCQVCPTAFQDQTNQKLQEQARKVDSLVQQKQILKDNLDEKFTLINRIQSKTLFDIQQLRNEILPLKEKIQQLSFCCQKIDETKPETSNFEIKIEQVRSESNLKITQIETKLNQVQVQQGVQQGEIELINTDISEMKKGSGFSDKDFAKHEARIKQLEEGQVTNQKAVVKTQEDVFNQESKIKSIQQEWLQFKQEQSLADTKVEILTETVNSQQLKIDTLRDKFSNLEKQVKQLEDDENFTRSCLEVKQTCQYSQNLDYMISGDAKDQNNRVFDAQPIDVKYSLTAHFKFEPMTLRFPSVQNWRDDLTIERVISNNPTIYKQIGQYKFWRGDVINRKSITQEEMRKGYEEVIQLDKDKYLFDFEFRCPDPNKICNAYNFPGKVTFSAKQQKQ